MNKKLLKQTFSFLIITLLLSGCYNPPVTQPPTPPCPAWGCGTYEPSEPTVTSTPVHPPLPPTSTPIPTDLPTTTPILPTEKVEPLVCNYRVSAVENSLAKQFLDTGLDLVAGETLNIKATGTACFDVQLNLCASPDGNPDFFDTDLIGKIGDGNVFHIGSSLEKPVSDEVGRLYLAFHDNDYENNSGYFDVTVTIVNSQTGVCPQQ
ncbi:MAG: hypothetical protein VB013_06570 [Anaerolineaceae bacterium]|nr:hypothetical protein [Anaerolineaceae bacterium]